MTEHIASTRVRGVTANIFRVPPEDGQENDRESYYWCCETCGACSQHFLSVDPAVQSSVDHVINAPIHQEANNG